MPLQKMGDFSFNHSDQQNDIANVYDSSMVKQLFDSRSNELKQIVNAIIDVLQSIEGAKSITAKSIAGLTGNDVQTLLEALKTLSDDNKQYLLEQIQGIVLDQIPDGSITEAKLAEDVLSILEDYLGHKIEFTQLKQTTEDHIDDADIHKTSKTIREESTTPLRLEVVSSVGSETPTKARIVFDDSTGKAKVGNGSAWV